MTTRNPWTRQQLLVAFELYCRIPFGRITSRHPEIIRVAAMIGRSPAGLSMKMGNIASLDPAITSTGRRGLGNASSADRAMWEEMTSNWENFAIESQAALTNFGLVEGAQDHEPGAEESFDETSRSGTDRPVLSTTRVGQDFFRLAVLSAYNYRCCITGLSVPRLLIASHIIPWRLNQETRVNPRNGLSLNALHDKAFDAGFLTIDESFKVRVSGAYREDAFFSNTILGYHGKPISLPEKFSPDPDFLAYHREHIFVG